MQNFSFSKVFEACVITAAVVFISSCVSRPPEYGVRAFAAAGAEADVYIFAPVAGNEPLLKAILTGFVPAKTAEQYLNRTTAVYAGVQYQPVTSIAITSAGSYPVGFSGLLFSKKDGWEKGSAAPISKSTYYTSAHADIILQTTTAYALLGDTRRDTAAFLQRVATPHLPMFPLRFQTLAETEGTNTIGLYAPSGIDAAAALFGLQDITLPVRSIEFYLHKHTDASYRYSAVFETGDSRIATALKLLLGAVLKGAISVQGSSVFVENADISEVALIQLLQGIMK